MDTYTRHDYTFSFKKVTLSVGFEDIESMKWVLVFKILYSPMKQRCRF
jgi:hypothetical protein